MRIGFPRALFYFLYYPFWHVFFTELGCEVVLSLPTTKYSLDLGVEEAVNDACLPIKLYHGHVAELKDQVDVLFLPRMVKIRKMGTEVFCPKFLGLPDLIRGAIADLPEIIDVKVDLSKGLWPKWQLSRQVAQLLDKKGAIVWQAYRRAGQAQTKFKEYLLKGIDAETAIEAIVQGKEITEPPVFSGDLNLAILGYPYLIYDSFVNVGLWQKLFSLGVRPWTVEMVPPKYLESKTKHLPKNLFWYFSNRTIQATFYYLYEKKLDGLIHVTAFGCGPDAMVDKLMELEAKKCGPTPFLTLSLDEQTGEAGVATRLEAFVDMLRLRRSKDENIFSCNG